MNVIEDFGTGSQSSSNLAEISIDLYALACIKLFGFGREFSLAIPDGTDPTRLAQAFTRLGCAVAIS